MAFLIITEAVGESLPKFVLNGLKESNVDVALWKLPRSYGMLHSIIRRSAQEELTAYQYGFEVMERGHLVQIDSNMIFLTFPPYLSGL